MTTTTEDTFLSAAKAADRLGISVDSWERHIRPGLLSGEIVNFKIGSRRIISWNSLLEYLERHHSGAIK